MTTLWSLVNDQVLYEICTTNILRYYKKCCTNISRFCTQIEFRWCTNIFTNNLNIVKQKTFQKLTQIDLNAVQIFSDINHK